MSVITVEIKNSKKGVMDPAYELMSVDILQEANRLPIAELVLLDGNSSNEKFPISESGFFDPGATISISARREESSLSKIFEGIVVRHSIRADRQGSHLVIELTDKAYALTMHRQSMVFREKTDSDAISKLVKDAGLKVKKVDPTTLKHQTLVQYDATDWDFILARAEANGMVVLVADGNFSAVKPKIGSPGTTFIYGLSEIYEADLQADARQQFKKVSAVNIDAKTRVLAKPSEGADPNYSMGSLKPASIATDIGGDEIALVTPTMGLPGELQAWATGTMNRSRISFIRGRIRAEGSSHLIMGSTVGLKGFGKVLSGKAYVTGIRHQISVHEWTTDVQLGMSAEPFSRQNAISSLPGAGLLPAVNGIQIGIVDAFQEDPSKEFRIKVKLLGLNQKDDFVWARQAFPDAGNLRGFQFRPEKGDEVIVGFINDDPRQPIILGSLHSSGQPAFLKNDPKNNIKGIVTRGKVGIIFDDKDMKLSLTTAADKLDQLILLDQKAKSIEIIDKLNKNTFKMDKNGIELSSEKTLSLKVKGDLKADVAGNIKLTAKGKVDIKGSTTNII